MGKMHAPKGLQYVTVSIPMSDNTYLMMKLKSALTSLLNKLKKKKFEFLQEKF
jgi:hypothetical protein